MRKKQHHLLLTVTWFLISSCYLIPVDILPSETITSPQTETIFPPLTIAPILTDLPTTNPTATFSPTRFPLSLQAGTPVYIKNFAYPDAGCQWFGLAGQVFNQSGTPVINLIVSIKGKLGNNQIDRLTMTGLKEGDSYGPGGYEIKLANSPVSSEDAIFLQVFDLDAIPLSRNIAIDTFQDCDKNLIIVNFVTENE